MIGFNDNYTKTLDDIIKSIDTAVPSIIDDTKSENENIISLKEYIYDLYRLKHQKPTGTINNLPLSNNVNQDLEILGIIDSFQKDINWISPKKSEDGEDKMLKSSQLIVRKFARTERAFPSQYIIKKGIEIGEQRYIVDLYFDSKIISNTGKEKFGQFFKGKTFIGEEDNIVRIYLNFKENLSKIEEIRNVIIEKLNEVSIPFELKHIDNLNDFERADTCIIYFKQSYSHTVFFLIGLIYNNYQSDFREELPLFVKKLDNGIGYAESPLNPAISFGEKRSFLIAEAYLKNRNSKNKLDDIKKFINDIKKFKVDEFYKNSYSIHYYNEFFFKKGKESKLENFNKVINFASGIDEYILNFHFNKFYKQKYIDGVIKIANLLCNEAIWANDDKCKWIGGFNNDSNIFYKIIDDSFENGSLGISLFLARAYFYIENYIYAKTALGAIQSLIEKISQNTNTTENYELNYQKYALTQIYRILKNRNIEKIEYLKEVINKLQKVERKNRRNKLVNDINLDTTNVNKSFFQFLNKNNFTDLPDDLLDEAILALTPNILNERPLFGEFDNNEIAYKNGDILHFIIVESERSFTNVLTSKHSDVFCPDIINGYAAIGHFFLRLFDPRRVWRIPNY